MGYAPDVLGWDLDDAVTCLQHAGFTYKIIETSPPREITGNNRVAVVRQLCTADDSIELTVSGFKQRLK